MVGAQRRKVIMHEEDGKHYAETRQDVDHIIQAAKDMWCDNPPKDFRRVAFIPDTVITQAFNEGWFHDETKWKQWANNSANAHLRTTKGTI